DVAPPGMIGLRASRFRLPLDHANGNSLLLEETMRISIPIGFILALLVAVTPAQAQQGTVTGRVVNSVTLQPIGGAQIFIAGLNLGTLSQSNGNYIIPAVPAGTHTVSVQFLGFAPASAQVTVS